MKTRWYLLLLAIPFFVASCSKDDNTVSSSNDYCYIKSVTLGTVKRKVGTISSSFPGSYYAMTINLRDNTIENRDSLPFGSLLDRVIATITFDGSILSYREKGSDSEWSVYNSTDSLDLTVTTTRAAASTPLRLTFTSSKETRFNGTNARQKCRSWLI